MVDYAKPFPCTECGKMVMSNEKHTFEDCKKQHREIVLCNSGVLVIILLGSTQAFRQCRKGG